MCTQRWFYDVWTKQARQQQQQFGFEIGNESSILKEREINSWNE